MNTPLLDEIDRLSASFESGIDATDFDARVENDSWSTAGKLIEHLGGIYLWVAETVRSGTRADQDAAWAMPTGGERAWFAEARATVLERLRSTDSERECWTLTGSGTAGFWSGRMHLETLMHLGDLRTAGGRTPEPVAEADVAAYSAGVDEHLYLFLGRSRSTLSPLRNSLALHATDGEGRWTISPDWQVDREDAVAETVIRATTGDLALFAWDRLEPLRHPDRFEVHGPTGVLAEYRSAPIHP